MTTATLNLKFKGTDYQVSFTTNVPNCLIEETQEFIQAELDMFPNSILANGGGIYPITLTCTAHPNGSITWVLTFALSNQIESFDLGYELEGKLIHQFSDPEVYSERAQVITTSNALIIIAEASM